MIDVLKDFVKLLKQQTYDDWVNRLHHYYTVLVIMIISLILCAKQMVGSPMQCWMPGELDKKGWEEYVETYCFVQSTYYLPLEKPLPEVGPKPEVQKIGYYQWVPIVLMIQALLFYVPNLIWNWLAGLSGHNIDSLMVLASDWVGSDPEKRDKNKATLTRALTYSLQIQTAFKKFDDFGSYCCAFVGGIDRIRGPGNYLCSVYLIVKILNLINIVCQLLFIDVFLNADGWFWGGRILTDILNGRNWTQSGRFPRVTMCDFDRRDIGQSRRYTVQCVLNINLWNEMVYCFLWFWMIFVTACSVWNLFGWIYASFGVAQRRFMNKYFHYGWPALDDFDADTERQFNYFVRHILRSDGILLLRFISCQAGDFIVMEVIMDIFKEYMKSKKYQQRPPRRDSVHLEIEPDYYTMALKNKKPRIHSLRDLPMDMDADHIVSPMKERIRQKILIPA